MSNSHDEKRIPPTKKSFNQQEKIWQRKKKKRMVDGLFINDIDRRSIWWLFSKYIITIDSQKQNKTYSTDFSNQVLNIFKLNNPRMSWIRQIIYDTFTILDLNQHNQCCIWSRRTTSTYCIRVCEGNQYSLEYDNCFVVRDFVIHRSNDHLCCHFQTV